MIDFDHRCAINNYWHNLDVNRQARSENKGHTSCVLWGAGLSGAGKLTIANSVEKKIICHGHHIFTLDGGNIRHGLNWNLGFLDVDRGENIGRVGEGSKLIVESGLITLVSIISPFCSELRIMRKPMLNRWSSIYQS